jgi:hypothetical protein
LNAVEVEVKSIKTEKSGWFITTNKQKLNFIAQKNFDFSFPDLPSKDIEMHKYKELENEIIYHLPIISLFSRKVNRKQVWKISSNLEFDNKFYGEYRIELNGLYNVILKIEYKKMSIIVTPKIIKPILNTGNFDEKLILEVNDNKRDYEKELVIKKRPLPGLWHFHTDVVNIESFETNKWGLKKAIDNIGGITEDLDIWDIFIRYKINNQISDRYVVVDELFEKKELAKEKMKFIFYKTRSNSLAIEVRISKNPSEKIDDIEETKEELIFKYGNFTNDKFIVKEKSNKILPQTFKFSLNKNMIKKNMLLETLPDLEADYELFLDNDFDENKLKNIHTKISFSSEKKEIEITNGNNKELVLKVRQKNNNKIRIAVLGSCYSRNMFNTSDYFNPDYKDIYKVVFTQFHSSVISAVSSPVKLTSVNEKQISESQLQYVKRDFQKSIFNELYKAKCQYLIIDFFVDATQPLIRTRDNKHISGNLHLRDTKLLKNWNYIDFERQVENEKYFIKWKEDLHEYMDNLLNIVPIKNIILVKGKSAYAYKDKFGNIQNVKNPKLSIQQNYFWERMNNYFLKSYPRVKVIDMTEDYWNADFKHPFGASLVHYSSEFYKEEFNRLNKIILKDILDNN